MFYLIKSWILGIAIAAPIGPIGMLCINKTLESGFVGACLVGLGAASADAIYGCVAAFGFGAISSFLLENSTIIKGIGGVMLLFLAYKELDNASSEQPSISTNNYLKLIGIVFLLTLSNPMTIMTFIGVFSSIVDIGTTSLLDSLIVVVGIFFGSMTWWLFLGIIVTRVQKRLPATWIAKIKYVASFILASFGLFSIYSVYRITMRS